MKYLHADRLGRVVWECIHFSADAPSHIAQAIRAWPVTKHVENWPSSITICTIDASAPGSLDDKVARELRFPSYYGKNLDALYDCLTDFSWLDFQALVLIVDNASQIWKQSAMEVGTFVEIWLAAAQWWAEREDPPWPFHLVFCLDSNV